MARSIHHRFPRPVRLTGVLVALCLGVLLGSRPSLRAEPTGSALLLEYTHLHHMLAEQDPVPLLRIYTDGRLLVHYPVYMQRAGDYPLELTAAELRSLFNGLADDGLLAVDLRRSRQERAALEAVQAAADGELRHISDTTETVIRVWPSRLSGRQSSADFGFDRTIRWPNVYTDARYYPEVEAVQSIARAEERLQQLIDRAHNTSRRQP